MEMVYSDFRSLAGSYLSGKTRNTVQATALVHEAFLRLVDQDDVDWRGRSHFLAVGATAMRQILVDHARKRFALKRGGGRPRVAFSEDLAVSPRRDADILALDEALEKLAAIDQRRAKIVEMRFFGGMTVEETAEAIEVSPATVKREWAMAKAWLYHELSDE